jgi:uncharacterized protein (TIGR02271 family)
MVKDSTARAAQQPLVIPVLREELRVGIRKVDTGGVRIHKTVRVHDEQVEASLLRDAVEVRRVPVDRVVAMSDAPATRQEGDTLIVPVLEEVLVIEKRLRIKEEIHITRTAREELRTESVTLRSEQVDIERFEARSENEVTTTNGGTHHATHTRSRI